MGEYYVEQENRSMAQDGIEFFTQHFKTKQGNVAPHIHSAVEILYILQGDFQVFSDDTAYIAHEGDAVLFRSNIIHRVYPMKDDSTYRVLKFKPDFILDISSPAHGASYLLSLALSNEAAKTIWSREECEANRLCQFFAQLFQEAETGGYGADMAVRICAAEIVLALLRDTEGPSSPPSAPGLRDENLTRRIYDAIVYINNHYAEEISAETCSQHVFLSYSYFSRSFKRITGKTFRDYLIATRISHAEKELVSTKKSITEISADCGFNSVSHFISTYRKLRGITPAGYRNSIG